MGAPTLKAGHSKGIDWLGDALGTTRDVIDETGAVIRSLEFTEYGDPISNTGTGTLTPKTFQGALGVNDDTNDSGMFNMGHRNWASDLGRFISRDPIGFAGGLNLFNGPATNPMTMVDPSGLAFQIELDGNLTNAGKQSAVNTFLYMLGRAFGEEFSLSKTGVLKSSARKKPNESYCNSDSAIFKKFKSAMDSKAVINIYLTNDTPIINLASFAGGNSLGSQVLDMGDIGRLFKGEQAIALGTLVHELGEAKQYFVDGNTDYETAHTSAVKNWENPFYAEGKCGLVRGGDELVVNRKGEPVSGGIDFNGFTLKFTYGPNGSITTKRVK